MSRLPMLPARVPAAAARLSRPEDPRSVAERSMKSRWATMPVVCFASCSTCTLIAPAKTRRAMPGESLAGPLGAGLGADVLY
jgi:hypothetical protein